ncbi:MAG: hypothetical protein ACLQCU_05090 [Acidimicrobiales bacterium]|jgi:hypothetical protein
MTRDAAPRKAGLAVLESFAAALALAATLVSFGSSLVGSYRPDALARPYWSEVGGLRTDTSGVVAFAVLVITLAVSEILRVSRRRTGAPSAGARQVPMSSVGVVATGLAAAGLVAGIGLVVYLSVNTVTHPATLAMRATHFASWPTEGTLRVLALAVAALALGWLRLVTIRHPGSWIGS